MNWTVYKKPKALDEALTLLQQANGKGRVIAGGTNLILQLKRHELKTDMLVDISEIQELKAISEEGDWIRIGAGVTHREVAKSPMILRGAKALAQGCGQVGSAQIRNMGTLVGNVVNAHSAADGAIPLMALEGELKVVSKEGERWFPLEEVYRGIGLSAVDATKEVATEVRFKKLAGHGKTGFFRMARRKALALPVVNGAVSIFFDASQNRIQKARIAIGPVAYKPFRPRNTELYLESMEISNENLLHACRIASEEGHPRTTPQALVYVVQSVAIRSTFPSGCKLTSYSGPAAPHTTRDFISWSVPVLPKGGLELFEYVISTSASSRVDVGPARLTVQWDSITGGPSVNRWCKPVGRHS